MSGELSCQGPVPPCYHGLHFQPLQPACSGLLVTEQALGVCLILRRGETEGSSLPNSRVRALEAWRTGLSTVPADKSPVLRLCLGRSRCEHLGASRQGGTLPCPRPPGWSGIQGAEEHRLLLGWNRRVAGVEVGYRGTLTCSCECPGPWPTSPHHGHPSWV